MDNIPDNFKLPSLSQNITNDDLLIELFLNKKQSKNTVRVYATEIEMFRQFFGYKPLATVSAVDVYEYSKTLSSYATATISRKLYSISSLYKYGQSIGYFKFNPIEAVKVPKVNSDIEKKFLTHEEVQKMLDTAKKNTRNYLIVALLISTGLRVSELAGIRWHDFYVDSYDNIGLRVIGKGNKARVIKIRKDVWYYITKYRRELNLPDEIGVGENTPLLLNKYGQKLSDRYIRQIIYQVTEKAKIHKDKVVSDRLIPARVSPHWIRHTSASFAVEGGSTMQQLREQYGWKSTAVADRYIHSVNQLKDTATDHINVKL